MKKNFTLIIFLYFTFVSYSQRIDLKHVINLCSNQNIQGTTPATNIYNNLRTPCSTQPLSTAITLYYVEIESGSTFTFTVSPNSPVDFDFASWKNPNFNNLGIADRGSQNTIVGINTFDIGLSLNEPIELCEGAGVAPPFTGNIPGMVRYYDVQPGDGILIAIDHWESSVIGYELSFGGDAILNCSIVDTTFETCDYDYDGKEEFDLDDLRNKVNNLNNLFTVDFFESENDANNISASNVLQSPFSVSSSESPKTIYARFKRTNGLLAKVVPFDLIVNEVAILPNHDLVLEKCDFDQNNNELFDLTEIENIIDLLNSKKITYKYYENKTDAENNSDNYITSLTNYSSNSKTLYLNISINDKCPLIVPLNLVVLKLNIIPKSIEYSEFCAEEDPDGLIYNLEKTYSYFIDNQNVNDYIFSVHKSIVEAENNVNSINNPEKYFVPYDFSETLFLRITNINDCYIISEIELNSKKRIKIQDQFNRYCDPYILPPLPKGYQYRTQPNGAGEILDPFSSSGIIYGKRTLYIYGNMKLIDVQTPEFNKCGYDYPFTVYNDNCSIPKGISPNGDGLNDNWDLTPFGVLELKIYNRYGKLVYNYGKDYTNQWDGKSNKGQILPSGTYMFSFESINGTKTGWVEIVREVKK